jgi:drug/metabolite transporter (DMT)-like permease
MSPTSRAADNVKV